MIVCFCRNISSQKLKEYKNSGVRKVSEVYKAEEVKACCGFCNAEIHKSLNSLVVCDEKE